MFVCVLYLQKLHFFPSHSVYTSCLHLCDIGFSCTRLTWLNFAQKLENSAFCWGSETKQKQEIISHLKSYRSREGNESRISPPTFIKILKATDTGEEWLGIIVLMRFPGGTETFETNFQLQQIIINVLVVKVSILKKIQFECWLQFCWKKQPQLIKAKSISQNEN